MVDGGSGPSLTPSWAAPVTPSGARATPPSTEAGHVYIITHPSFEGWVKVGLTTGDVEKRLSSYQTGCPHRAYEIHMSWEVTDVRMAESLAHTILQSQLGRHNRRREWFRCKPAAAEILIRDTMEEFHPDYEEQLVGPCPSSGLQDSARP